LPKFVTFNVSNSGAQQRGVKVAQFPGRRITMGTPHYCASGIKVPTLSQCTFFNTVHCSRKTSGSNIGAQTSFLPWAPSNLVTPLIECLVRTTSHGTLRPFNSFLILLNLEKDLSPEQLVTIKLRNKASRGCIN